MFQNGVNYGELLVCLHFSYSACEWRSTLPLITSPTYSLTTVMFKSMATFPNANW